MVPMPSGDESLVYDVRLTSVVPARIAGENKIHELSNMDLATKLHYIKAIYLFDSEAARGLTNNDFKKAMFSSLVPYYRICGRIRTSSENGTPHIKCNDSGVRVVEAKCSKTIGQLMELMNDSDDDSSLIDQLTHTQILSPDLGFTPLVFVQFTWFQCGGFSVGLSWAHLLGDAFSASQFINTWHQFLTTQSPPCHFYIPTTTIMNSHNNKKSKLNPPPLSCVSKVPSSLQRVQLDGVGNQWLISNGCKMQNHSFHITPKQISELARVSKLAKKLQPFEVISAMIWKSLAKVRGKYSEPKSVTICTRNDLDYSGKEKEAEVSIGNTQLTIWTVEAANYFEGAIAEADLTELANLIAQEKVNETSSVEKVMDEDGNNARDGFILYGANLTFVNLEGLHIYGLEFGGHKPVFANYSLSGVGDEGAVLVLPGHEEDHGTGGKEKEQSGRMVNLILPENQLEGLKQELQNEWNIF